MSGTHPEGEAATGRLASSSLRDADNSGKKTYLLNPADKVVIGYLGLTACLILIFSYRIQWWALLIGGHAFLIGLVVLFAGWRNSGDARPIAFFLGGWYPVALIPITYKELSYLIPLIHPRDFDAELAAIDHRFLGVHPTVWLERFTAPSLTEILQLTYSSYYFLPVILGVVLWRKGWLEKFHFWVFIVILGFYLSYLGYIAVPAIGPRFLPEIVQAQAKQLTGIFFFQPIRAALDSAEGITRDCFPSGHTELTLLVLYYAHKFHRKTFWWLLPFGAGVIISTVYLRYHYVIDVVAGALVAFAIIVTAKSLYRLLGGNEISQAR